MYCQCCSRVRSKNRRHRSGSAPLPVGSARSAPGIIFLAAHNDPSDSPAPAAERARTVGLDALATRIITTVSGHARRPMHPTSPRDGATHLPTQSRGADKPDYQPFAAGRTGDLTDPVDGAIDRSLVDLGVDPTPGTDGGATGPVDDAERDHHEHDGRAVARLDQIGRAHV